jgi:3,4-dihydroxy 2-butanone 4-phosphate synthase/GTP cyclohydrolase II
VANVSRDDVGTPTDEAVRVGLAAFAAGRPVVVLDDVHGRRDGALVFAAELASACLLAFVVRYSSGFVRAALTEEDCDRLALPPLLPRAGVIPDDPGHCVTVDLIGTGTGISASARARTIAALASPTAVAGEFTRPGHVVPVWARPDGVLDRLGQAEAAVDLARLSGLRPAGGLAEIVGDESGELVQGEDLSRFAEEHGLVIVSLGALADYRRRHESHLIRDRETVLPTTYGPLRAVGFHAQHEDFEVLALIAGEVGGRRDVLVRVTHECVAGALLGPAAECGCGSALADALRAVADEGRGVVLRVRAGGPVTEPNLASRSDGPRHLVDDVLDALEVRSVRFASNDGGRPGHEPDQPACLALVS